MYRNQEKGNFHYDERRHPRGGALVADLVLQQDGTLPGQRTGIHRRVFGQDLIYLLLPGIWNQLVTDFRNQPK